MIEVPVSWGELIDKITILQIKADRIADAGKRANVERELALLTEKLQPVATHEAVGAVMKDLREVNTALWVIEDDIRDCEREGDFGSRFIELARSVYITNDRRAELKRDINVALGSGIIEEKSYKPYAATGT
ncbi:DUF6165 family protein [Allorhizobium undicola]|uniref:DUF6165 family protein n=1 Tax=Allorhizobium undicola TaxID=78527 RepID=UPI000484AD2A|nr:DUF6165 family protein [Allorhizobium undicola]